ncbi:GntR family transcriptional regulator [Bacteroides reticulotermitis]|uniref:Transcriptional regulator n=2 Tax=Bacteroides reticulotermitis TaxID=1133319 RepID=W4UW88_9BACE|nr:GntR family transcriptional regulator [Bacteroides reticulotermitis]MBB4042283.1 DNA-binding transcriptional regulator YhcF (GntR family) [Bacteroides reticulotermitis]GAE85206.1 transcriptional regulator [Bacteroides reticulotermitis JCM 10512]
MKLIFGQQTTKVKQLADTLGQAISMNEYRAGDPLPSINQLSAKYAVSRDTVFKAFLDLRKRGLIDSTPGKGYYVTNKLTNVLLLLDEYTPFKDALYNSFIKGLSINYKVDLLFHQYNERLFNTIIRESIGRYNKYIVMNFHNEKFSRNLSRIDSSKLLLLDFGKFDKASYSYLCQDFDQSFYDALTQLDEQLRTYKRLVMIFPKGSYHPQSTKEYFHKFCIDNHFLYEVKEEVGESIERGDVYIVIKQQDVVNIIKQGRAQGLKCGKDFGLLAYNDIPSYEVIDDGITSLSIDWDKVGARAAEFVLFGKPVREYLPTEVRLRNSL